jgi:hypothetical protein
LTVQSLIRTDQWPLAWVRLPPFVEDSAVDELLDELNHLLEQPEPYVLLFDLSDVKAPKTSQRLKLAQHMLEQKKRIVEHVKGLAIIAPSAITRGFVHAVFWIYRPPTTFRMFHDEASATEWARGLLAS